VRQGEREGLGGAREKMFSGTQQKCKVCTKTVYPMDQLSTDGVVFHRSCFKCQHCKSTLSVRSLAHVLF
jgi:hypothetical protein